MTKPQLADCHLFSARVNKIGVFDSGVGGLTVLREITQVLPNENVVYLGDTARLPYGNKSPEAIVRFAQDNAQFLIEQQIKLLVIACHTACTHALEILKNTLPVPVIGVTESGIHSSLQTTKNNRVAILGTTSTIQSGLLQSQLLSLNPSLQLYPVACPLFVPLVEERLISHPATQLIAEHYLSPLRSHSIDTALLACTHYPLLSSVIQQTLGPSTQLIFPARTTALAVRAFLHQHHLLNPQTTPAHYHFFASDNPEKFQQSAALFFSAPIHKVHLRNL